MEQTVSKLDEYFSHIPTEGKAYEKDIADLREWIKTQPHLPFISNRQLSMFLHSCHDDLEATKTCVEQYYTLRTQSSEIFTNRKVEDLKAYLNVSYVYKDTHLSLDGHQILHIGFLDKNSDKFDVLQSVKMLCVFLDLHTNLMPFASGWRLCADVKCISFGHYLKLTSNINLARKFIVYLTTAMPIRLKGIHIRNANSLMCQFVNMLRPFLKKEIFDLIQLHSATDETLLNYLPKEAIPYQDYENLFESSERLLKRSLELLDEYQAWLADEERLARTDEIKRIRPPHKMNKGASFFKSFIGGRSE